MSTKTFRSDPDWAQGADRCGPISAPCLVCGVGIHVEPAQLGVYVVDIRAENGWTLTDDPAQGYYVPLGWSCWRRRRDDLEGMVFEGLSGVKARMLR